MLTNDICSVSHSNWNDWTIGSGGNLKGACLELIQSAIFGTGSLWEDEDGLTSLDMVDCSEDYL